MIANLYQLPSSAARYSQLFSTPSFSNGNHNMVGCGVFFSKTNSFSFAVSPFGSLWFHLRARFFIKLDAHQRKF
jgi:hypothetical protein